tara:strand:+ start:445 stop:708 length:264 start_codon:yes stop_codon:yes gene_type:complete
MIPELPELPEIKSAQVAAINSHHYKALPGMPHLRWESILGYNPREVEAAAYAAEVARAYEITRLQNKIMEARARARNRLAQKEAERR